MKRLTCEMCGSTDLIKQDGVFVCQTCGCKYSIEEAKKMMVEGTVDVSGSTVKVDNSGLIDSYLQMAENAMNANNNEEAEKYANKIIEIDPHSYKAWLIKGNASGWQTTDRNNRYPESIINWSNAFSFAPDNEKENLGTEIQLEAMQIGTAIIQMECNSFVGYRSQENFNDVTNALDMLSKQLGILREKTGVNVYTSDYKTVLARTLNTGAVNASQETDKDFGPENSDKTKYSWNQFMDSQDRCLQLLDKAYSLSSDDDLSCTICKNYISIDEEVRDSCSYTYSNGYYVEDYSLTSEAKNNRTKRINEWKKKKDCHDPVVRKKLYEKSIELVKDAQHGYEKEQAIDNYWRAHSVEKEQLNHESENLTLKATQLKTDFENHPTKIRLEKINEDIFVFQKHLSSLGFFKGKEKKALQQKIADLTAEKTQCESQWQLEQSKYYTEQDKIKAAKHKIKAEFSKERGTAKVIAPVHLTLLNGNKYVPTGPELVEYHKKVFPSDITVKETGGSAIENYTHTMILNINSMMKEFAAFLGEEKATRFDPATIDDNTVAKEFRVHFEINGIESSTHLSFSSKNIAWPIEESYYYELEDEKTAEDVADFVIIVTAALLGICPNIDVMALQKMIISVAYSFEKDGKITSDGLLIEVTGGSKESLRVALKPSPQE